MDFICYAIGARIFTNPILKYKSECSFIALQYAEQNAVRLSSNNPITKMEAKQLKTKIRNRHTSGSTFFLNTWAEFIIQ